MADVVNKTKEYVESEVADTVFAPGQVVSLPDKVANEAVKVKGLEVVVTKKKK